MADAPRRSRRNARHSTRSTVKIVDALARWVITVGGIGTIAAIMAVAVFLFWVAWPLFRAPRVAELRTLSLAWNESAPARIALDENGILGWALEPGGTIRVFRASDGLTLVSQKLSEEGTVTAWTPASPGSESFALGFADGKARAGRIHVVAQLLSDAEAQQALETPEAGEGGLSFPYQDGLAERLGENRVRVHRVEIQLDPPFETGLGEAVRTLDFSEGIRGARLAALGESGKLVLLRLRQRSTLLGRAANSQEAGVPIDYARVKSDPPRFVVLSDAQLFLAWPDGALARFVIRNAAQPQLAESTRLLGDDASLTALVPLIGRGTLVAGDSLGRANAWFLTKPEDAESADRARLTLAHRLPEGTSAVTALAASGRSRLVAVGYENGQTRVMQVTTRRNLATAEFAEGAPIASLAISPREDAVIAATAKGIALADLELQHPEATLAALFAPVWYQDYNAPAHVWQSTSGGQATEPKLGVMPLVFGTIKATIYSLLFGVPIALCAAIYTSEFLSRETRARVKPTIELMASLPSVVLGYLAAFVVAPFVARNVPAVLASFATIPAIFLFSAYLLQLVPERWALRLKWRRFTLICLSLPVGIALAALAGPRIDHWFFKGDFIRWLDGVDAPATGGWLLLLLPLVSIGWAFFSAREINPRLRRASIEWTPARCALVDLAKFLIGVGACLGIALALSVVLDRSGYDPRGSFIGTYVQRNALVVGFAMGFAIIPLIYTIAEDALSAVPDHLRSASLGAGATPWQTTIRIVVPTAMSGLFSAVMIGLGRAVGETMIVLMAAGNTPIMEWNIFNGFRTLSANLAVELPEAEQGSTHFRVLFLTALLLFVMTFIVNTLAEWVRQRYRRRAYQL